MRKDNPKKIKPGTEGRRQSLCRCFQSHVASQCINPQMVTVPPASGPAGSQPLPQLQELLQCHISLHFPSRAVLLMSHHPGRSWRQWLPGQQSREQLDFSFSPSQSASGGSHHSFSAHGSKAQPRDKADYWHKYRYIYQWI